MTYYGKHASMSQWVKAAKLSWADDLISEDATKRDRLQLFNRLTGLPLTPSLVFSYEQVTGASQEFNNFREQIYEDERYALRLNPNASGLAVFRNRDLTVSNLIDWAMALGIDLRCYDFTFEPHIVSVRAAILVVGEDGVSGEAANGGILDLNSGNNPDVIPYVFNWNGSLEIEFGCPGELSTFIERVLQLITVPSASQRQELSRLLDVQFNHDMARGYYEAISDASGSVWFTDFNRVLKAPLTIRVAATPAEPVSGALVLHGHCGCAGFASGRARLLAPGVDVIAAEIQEGDVLVCRQTEPEHIPLICEAVAVVTDLGGVLSHAAIVARELGKPCVVGTRTATFEIHDGDFVEVRATEGTVVLRSAATGADHAGT